LNKRASLRSGVAIAAAIIANTTAISKNAIAIEALIQIGLSTHSHDHAITPHSLSVINTMVKSPQNPITPLDDEEVLLMAL
jgi:hypothetical protein